MPRGLARGHATHAALIHIKRPHPVCATRNFMRSRYSAANSEERLSELLSNNMYKYGTGDASDASDEDNVVDFTNAVLYVGAFQIISATVVVALVSVLSCTLFPTSAVSAVRTLVLSSIAGALLVRKPFRLGRTHGLVLIFNALRPAVPIYISTLIFEQLVHSCARDAASPSYRRLVFHAMTIVCMISGLARARKPLEHTDRPFLATASALFVIAMLPPPAVVLSGPLCAATTFASAAERLARAFVFSLLYSIFVYASAPPVQCSGETLICTMRASAASIWVLGCHALFLPLAAVQASIVIYVRIYKQSESEYQPIGVDEDVEYGGGGDAQADHAEIQVGGRPFAVGEISPVRDQHATAAAAQLADDNSPISTSSAIGGIIKPTFSSIGPRSLVDISSVAAQHPSIGIASEERMREIAARLENS